MADAVESQPKKQKRKQGKHRNRKWGRNKDKCALYAAQHRRTRNNPARTQRNPERTPH